MGCCLLTCDEASRRPLQIDIESLFSQNDKTIIHKHSSNYLKRRYSRSYCKPTIKNEHKTYVDKKGNSSNNNNIFPMKTRLDTVREYESNCLKKGKTVEALRKMKMMLLNEDVNDSWDNNRSLMLYRVHSTRAQKRNESDGVNNERFGFGTGEINTRISSGMCTGGGDSSRKIKTYHQGENSFDSITNMFNKYKFVFEDNNGNMGHRGNSYSKKKRVKGKGGNIKNKGSKRKGKG